MNRKPFGADADFRDPVLADLVGRLGLYRAKTPNEFEWRLQTRTSHAVYQGLRELRAKSRLHNDNVPPPELLTDDREYYEFLNAHPDICRATLEGRLAFYDRLLPPVRKTLADVPRTRILDLGSFAGLTALYLGAAFPGSTVVGVERLPGVHGVAEGYRRAAGADNVSLVNADYDDYRPDAPFDIVVSLHALPSYMLPWVPSESPEDYRRGRNLAAEIDNPSSTSRAVLRSLNAVRSFVTPTGHAVFDERLRGLSRALMFHALLARAGLEVLHAHMVDWHMAAQMGETQTSLLIVARACPPPAPLDEAAVIDLYGFPAGFTDLSDLPAGQTVQWQGIDAHTMYRHLPGVRDELVIAGEAKGGHSFQQRLGVLDGRLAYVFLCDTTDRRNLFVTHTPGMRPLFKFATDQLRASQTRGEVVRIEPAEDKLDYALTKRFRRYEP